MSYENGPPENLVADSSTGYMIQSVTNLCSRFHMINAPRTPCLP